MKTKFKFDTTIKIGPLKFNLAETIYNCTVCGNPAMLKFLITKNNRFKNIFKDKNSRWFTTHGRFCSTKCIKVQLLKMSFDLNVSSKQSIPIEQYIYEPDDNSCIVIEQPMPFVSYNRPKEIIRKDRLILLTSYGPPASPFIVITASKIKTKWPGSSHWWEVRMFELFSEEEFNNTFSQAIKPSRLK